MLFGRLLRIGKNSFNQYLKLRQKAIESRYTDFNKSANGELKLCKVFAVLCDFNYTSKKEGERYTSLACYSDGTEELFTSKGQIIVSSQHQSEQLKKESLELLYDTEQVLSLFQKTNDFFLPDNEIARIYAITNDGIFMIEYNLNFTWAQDNKLSKICSLSTKLIALIRNSDKNQ